METGWILPLSYHPKTIIMDSHDPQVVLHWMDYDNVGAEKNPLCWKSWSDVKIYTKSFYNLIIPWGCAHTPRELLLYFL